MALAGSLKTFLKVPLGCSSKVSLRFCKGLCEFQNGSRRVIWMLRMSWFVFGVEG